MQDTQRKIPFINSDIVQSLAGLTLLLGVIVIFGWHTNNWKIVQVFPQYAPMQFNTAFGFLLCGTGVLILSFSAMTARICGIILALLGTLTLAQYIFLVDFQIDELVMEGSILTKVSHPGRMAPQTALCFLLSGIALILYKRRLVLLSIASCLAMFSVLALSGYIIDTERLYGVANLTRMALHTSAGFMLLSLCFFFFYKKSANTQLDVWEVSPFIVFFIFVILTLYLWQTTLELVDYQNKKYFESLIYKKSNAILNRFALYEQALLGGVGFIRGSTNVDRTEWKEYVSSLNIQRYLPGVNGLGFIDYVKQEDIPAYIEKSRADGMPNFTNHPGTEFNDKFVIKYIEPANINWPAIGLDIGFETHRRVAAEHARDSGMITLSKVIFLVQDDEKLPGFLFLAPVYDSRFTIPETIQQRRATFKGWIYFPFMARNFMTDLDDLSENQVALSVYEDKLSSKNTFIFSDNVHALNQSSFAHLTMTTSLQLAENEWKIKWTPTSEFLPKANVQLPSIVLVVGMIATIIFSTLLYLLSKIYGKSARELDNNRKRLDSIFNNAVDGIITMNDKWIIEAYNPACEHIFGYRSEEAIGQKIRILIPELRQETHKSYFNSNGEKQVDTNQELEGKRNSGEIFPIELSGSEIHLQEKHLFSIFVRDISERKMLIDKLTKSNIELERFAYVASHDLQEPLRMVRNFTSLLQTRYGDQLDEDANKYIEFAVSSAKRMQALVADLLEYARVGREDETYETVNGETIIKYVLENLYARIKESGAVVTHDPMPSFVGNPVRLSRVLQNLIGNGLKYQPNDRIPHVHIFVKEHPGEWLFSIQDNGIGMKQEYCEQIFQPFKRLHSKHEYVGTGIGLAICHRIIDNMNGKIWAESKEGEGSTFHITIPKIELPILANV